MSFAEKEMAYQAEGAHAAVMQQAGALRFATGGPA